MSKERTKKHTHTYREAARYKQFDLSLTHSLTSVVLVAHK